MSPLGLFERPKASLCLDGGWVRMVACRGNAVERWQTLPLDPRLLRSGFIADAEGFCKALAASSFDLPSRRTVCGLPGFNSLLQIMELPKAAGSKLDAVVMREARRQIPSLQDNMQIFWQRFGPRDAVNLSVYVLAVPRQPLMIFLESLRLAGIRPRHVDLRPLALARAINRKDAIIGHIDSIGLEVVIVRDDVPVVVRSVLLGDGFLPRDVTGPRLADDLARTVNHYNNTSKHGPLSPDLPVYLTGAGAYDQSLPSLVEEATQRRVASTMPPFECPDDFPASEYMANLGLIMKED